MIGLGCGIVDAFWFVKKKSINTINENTVFCEGKLHCIAGKNMIHDSTDSRVEIPNILKSIFSLVYTPTIIVPTSRG